MENNQQPTSIEDLDQAVLSGQYQFQPGTKVNVVDEAGEVGSVPSEDLVKALQSGYKVEKPTQYAVRKYVEENKGAKGAAKSFLYNMADEASLGVLDAAYSRTGDPLEVAKLEALRKDHDVANALGGLTGFGASMVYGGPLFKGAAKAGSIAGKAATKALEGVGKAAQGAAKLAAGEAAAETVGKIGSSAIAQIGKTAAEKSAQLGLEGAIGVAPKALTEAALGDTEAAGETMLWGAGVGAGLGLAGGTLSGSFGKLVEKQKVAREITDQLELAVSKGESPEKFLDSLPQNKKQVGEEILRYQAEQRAAGPGGTLNDALEAYIGDKTFLGKMQKSIAKKTANAKELTEDATALGVNIPEHALLDDSAARTWIAVNTERPTAFGIKLRQQRDQAIDEIGTKAKEALGELTDETADMVGAKLKAGINEKVKGMREELKPIFEAVGQTADAIPIQQGRIKGLASEILDDPFIKSGMDASGAITPQAVFARDATRLLANAQTLQGVEETIKQLRSLVPMGAPGAVLKAEATIRSKLEDFYEDQLERAVRANLKGPEQAVFAEGLLTNRKIAKKRFEEMMEDLSEVGAAVSGGGKMSKKFAGPDAFLNFIDNLPNEKLAEKLFTKKNAQFLKNFSEAFPEQANELRQFARKSLLDKSVVQTVDKGATFSPRSFLREWDKMSPEAKQFLAKDAQIIDKLKKLDDRIIYPRQMNPSGSGIYLDWSQRGLFDRALSEAEGAAAYAFAKQGVRNDGIFAAAKAMKEAAKRMDEIDDAITGLGRDKTVGRRVVSIGALARLTGEKNKKKAFDVVTEKISEAVQGIDPQIHPRRDQKKKIKSPKAAQGILAEALTENGAPKIAQIYHEKYLTAINHLYQVMPKRTSAPNPFDPEPYQPADYEIAQFERRLAVVEDPFVVFGEMKKGQLTKDQVDTLNAVYPSLYKYMKTRAVNKILKNPKKFSYQAKLNMGYLLDMPFDTAMMNISQYQTTFAQEEQQAENTGLVPNPSAAALNLASRSDIDNDENDA